MDRLHHIWSTHKVKPPLDQSRTTQHPRQSGEWERMGRFGSRGATHRGRGQGRLANQVGVRDGHAEAQPRARLLHGRYRRLEVAGEGRGGGGRRGRRVGGLRGKQIKGEKIEREDRKREGVRVMGVKERRGGKTGF